MVELVKGSATFFFSFFFFFFFFFFLLFKFNVYYVSLCVMTDLHRVLLATKTGASTLTIR